MSGWDPKKRYKGLFEEPRYVQMHECVQMGFPGWGVYAVYARDKIVVGASGKTTVVSFTENGPVCTEFAATRSSTDGAFILGLCLVYTRRYEQAILQGESW